MCAAVPADLLGQRCAPKRNLTWGLHWTSRAEELGQADAQALMGFLHASDALRELYNFTGLTSNVTHGRVLYERAAQGGSTFAAMALGFRYGYGIGLRESCPESAAMYEKAAQSAVSGLDRMRRKTVEQSNPNDADHLQLLSKAMPPKQHMDVGMVEYMDYCAHIGDVQGKVAMGHLYHSGTHDVPEDKRAAQDWFTSAAQQGDATGHANLGMMQLRQRRYHSAVRSLRRATKQPEGSASAWAGLGYAHLYGAGVPRSDEKGAKAIWNAARLGHLDSIYNMGVLTLAGRGVKANVQSGFRFLTVAAEFQHPQAQLHVGHMIRLGLGVRQNCNTAQFFLKHAAEAGPLVRSLMSTALSAFEQGRTQRSLMHYLLAAHAGVDSAQHNAAHLYAHAMPAIRKEETEHYKRRATQMFKFAVLQGSVDAQVQLGNLLADAGDYLAAARLYQEAGRAGNTDALFHLGMLYWGGNGVKASAKTAFALWQSSEFTSKHAQLRGLQKPFFGIARFILEYRAFLLFAGGIGAIVSSGGNPIDVVRNAMRGGGGEEDWADDGDDGGEDLFGDD